MTKTCAFAFALTILAACSLVRIPQPPGPAPVPEPTPPTPICKVGETCGCYVQPPGKDWEKLPDCSTEPTPPPDTVPPVLTTFPVRFPVQGARIFTRIRPYNAGFDSTPWVDGDDALAKKIHGDVGRSPFHLDSRVWASGQRADYEGWVLAGARDGLPLPAKPLGPVWQFRIAGSEIIPAQDDQNAAASADHFGTTSFRDDPKTPEFEGQPAWLANQTGRFGPYAGFFTIAHGDAEVRVCPPLDTSGANCSDWVRFNH